MWRKLSATKKPSCRYVLATLPNNATVQEEVEEYPEDFQTEEDIENAIDSGLSEVLDGLEKVNTDIEKFLADIDKKYGTSYRPTGYARGQ